MKTKIDLLTGNVTGSLIRLALPIMAGMALQTAFNLVDTWFVSRLGPEAIAAVSMNIPLFFVVLALGSAVSVGTSSLVAQAVGARDMARASLVAGQALTLALAIGLATGIAGTALARPLLELMGAEGLALEYAVQYTRIILAGNPIFFLYMALDGVLRGEGDMKTSMLILSGATLLNIVLDPLFIFGLGPFPAMGVAGAAAATMLARLIGLLVIFYHFSHARSAVVFSIYRWQWNWEVIRAVLRIGIPTAISHAMLSLTMFIYNMLGNQFGSHVVAALGLGFRVDSLAFMPGMAVAIAGLTMVGQNFGAGKLERVGAVWRTALLMVMASMGGMGLFVLAWPQFFAGIFIGQGAVFDQTVLYLSIVPAFYGFLGMGIVTSSAFQGLGRGFPALFVNVVRLGIVGLPLAVILTRWADMGPVGLWWALAASDLAFAVVGILWFGLLLKKLQKAAVTEL